MTHSGKTFDDSFECRVLPHVLGKIHSLHDTVQCRLRSLWLFVFTIPVKYEAALRNRDTNVVPKRVSHSGINAHPSGSSLLYAHDLKMRTSALTFSRS